MFFPLVPAGRDVVYYQGRLWKQKRGGPKEHSPGPRDISLGVSAPGTELLRLQNHKNQARLPG